MVFKLRRKLAIKKRYDINKCKLPLRGNIIDPDIMLVMDPVIGTPSAQYPLTPRMSSWLMDYAKSAGINPKDCLVISSCPPVDKETWDSDRLMGEHIKEHRDKLVDVIKGLKPRLIISFGKHATRAVSGRGCRITQDRGLAVRESTANAVLLPMYSPGYVHVRPENLELFEADWHTVAQLKKAKYRLSNIEKVETHYEWRTDISDLLKKRPRYLSVDCETKGLRYYDPATKLLCVQLTWEPGKAVLLPIDYNPFDKNGNPYTEKNADKWKPGGRLTPKLRSRIKKQLKQLLEDPNVRCFGHNFKFDFQILRHKLGIEVANYYQDTITLVHAIDENMLNKSLDDSVRRWVREMSGYADDFNRDPVHQGKTRMDLVPPHKMLNYGGGDTDAAFRLRKNLNRKLSKDKKAAKHHRIVVMPALRAFCDIEENGFNISVDALNNFEKFLRRHQNKEYKALLKNIPSAIKAEFVNTGVGLKLTRGDFMRAVLFTHPKGFRLKPQVFTKTGKISVSTKQHLPYFDTHPFVARLMKYIKNDKMLNTYVGRAYDKNKKGPTGFYQYIFDGKIRPSYNLHRTVTGRTSSADPNGQNFPKRGEFAKAYRKIFIARPGHVIIEADFSQVELRIAAILANEPTMLKLYRQGADIHTATAAFVNNLTLKQFKKLPYDKRKFMRFQAKAVNFGFIYGMGWKSFRSYAKTEYGIDLTDNQAQNIRRLYFRRYANLERWHNKTRDFVDRHGYVRALDGRIRHLQSIRSNERGIAAYAERQAINAPVQTFANDMGLLAISAIVKEISRDFMKVIGFIHDAILLEVPMARAVEAMRTVKAYMEGIDLEKLFGITLPIPIPSEADIGLNMAEMIEIDLDSLPGNVITWQDVMKYHRDKCDTSTDDGKKEYKRITAMIKETRSQTKVLRKKLRIKRKPGLKIKRKVRLAA